MKVKIVWSWEDIRSLRPDWSKHQCETWLAHNGKYIIDRSIELGWEVIETLLDDSEEVK
jgi:hypothetical protein